MFICSRAPVRVDFAGGWTDVPMFTSLTPGHVVNTAITLYTYVTVTPRQDSSIKMYSADLNVSQEASSVSAIEYNGSIDLVKAACKRLNISGVEIVTHSEAPPGSGLGTSASLGVALVGALMKYSGRPVKKREVADLAYRLEVEELGLLSGTQDQYAAAFGGCHSWFCEDTVVDGIEHELLSSFELELERRIVLCYTGISRLSSKIHEQVAKDFNLGVNHAALKHLLDSAQLAYIAFERQEKDTLGVAIHHSWLAQKQMHQSISNETVEKFFKAGEEFSIAGKACGAGGGGCLLFLSRVDAEYKLKKALKEAGDQILNFHFNTKGLRVWEV